MKPSELKKSQQISLRINPEMRERLEKLGIGLQELFDKALDHEIGRVDFLIIPPGKKKAPKN